jgi:DNA-binding transcriptional LysR family regulator
LKAEIVDAGRGVPGRLAVGFFTSLSSDVFRQVLSGFSNIEGVRLDLREGTACQQLTGLHQHRIDLAITVGPIADPAFNTESLWSEHLMVVTPTDHPLSTETTLSWSGLGTERLILRASEQDHSIADYVSGLAAAAGCRPQFTEYLTTRENMVGLVRAGFGIALLPESSLLSLNTDRLACIPMTGPGTEMDIVGAWLPENANPVLRRFLEAVTLAVRENRRLPASRPPSAPPPPPISRDIPDPTG